MRVAHYVSKLVDDRERQFETKTSIKALLNRDNLFAVSKHAQDGVGEYFDVFKDDMALARTVVTFDVDNDGRTFFNLDVIVTKYDGSDRELILQLLEQTHKEGMVQAQNNGGTLCNPLPEVEL